MMELRRQRSCLYKYKVENNTFTPMQMAINNRTGLTLTNQTEFLGSWKECKEELFQKE